MALMLKKYLQLSGISGQKKKYYYKEILQHKYLTTANIKIIVIKKVKYYEQE